MNFMPNMLQGQGPPQDPQLNAMLAAQLQQAAMQQAHAQQAGGAGLSSILPFLGGQDGAGNPSLGGAAAPPGGSSGGGNWLGGAAKGASMGAALGPWGALGGGVLGGLLSFF